MIGKVEREVRIATRLLSAGLALSLAGAAAARAQSPPVAAAQAHELNLSAYAELLRNDVRTQKVAILSQLLALSEDEDKAFWPIYRECESAMATLGDERVALIEEYTRTFLAMTEAAATSLGEKALALESKRQAAKAHCYKRVTAAVSPKTALRFLQIEHQLQLLIDLQISAALPVID